MSVDTCIQKIRVVENQILNCKVQNTHLKSLIFKLNRKVELGSRTIKYLHYYYNEIPERFNSKQTSNTLIGFLASLESNYQYINPVEDSKGGFLNQLLGLSEDNVKREFYFLLQSLDESIIEVQDILERVLFISFNELPDLDTLSASPATDGLSLSPSSTLNEALSNINDNISNVKSESSLESPVEINQVLNINSHQEESKSETNSLQTKISKIDVKLNETTPEVKQAQNESNLSKPDSSSSDSTEFQEKEETLIQKSDLEIIPANSKIEDQAMNNENISEIHAIKEDVDNAQQDCQNNNISMQMPSIPQQFLPNPIQYSYPEYPNQQHFAYPSSQPCSPMQFSYPEHHNQQQLAYPPSQATSPVQFSYPGYPSQHQFAYPPSQVSSPMQSVYPGPIYNNPYPVQPIYYISPNYSVPTTTQTIPNHSSCETPNTNQPNPSQTPPLPPRRIPTLPQAQSSAPSSLPSGPKIPPPLPERRASKPSSTQPITENSSNPSPCESPSALSSSPVQTPPLPPRKPSTTAPKRRYKPLPTPPVLQSSTA
ncbi:hypothetical protein CONCODRAFT_16593 [Conidiobolus coronatus NRRL 28638]|uniref:Uncharacterized protein n=1 Tax=Conidiobolus coronatus (strain ATCC 28846 / CBS 209.66 / NRRL 28638) TaxID=796925 RepID=A0A137PAA9_CONC2|nr:hypothetical protein CONCODRAFT_16593 [Conidiobolus coronatus NRRL 28638]|eukprot:KXN71938.1 hypothetical protein CONCODRAFT_16593 [Conidiobolus coronatus NRRL 28638]